LSPFKRCLLKKYPGKILRQFSSAAGNNEGFGVYEIPKTILKRMNGLGVVTPTDIQRRVST